MSSSSRRAPRLLPRLRRLLVGRNELRRPSDRIEGAVMMLLFAAFLTAAVTAALFAGHLYQSQRAVADRTRPSVAVLSRPGPATTSRIPAAVARWRLPTGTERSGTLTTVTAPAIYQAPAGTTVRIWLNRSGEPVAPPPSTGDMIFNALMVAGTFTAGAAMVLALCYLLCRMVLDRHRLTRWESAWAAVGPRWTSHR